MLSHTLQGVRLFMCHDADAAALAELAAEGSIRGASRRIQLLDLEAAIARAERRAAHLEAEQRAANRQALRLAARQAVILDASRLLRIHHVLVGGFDATGTLAEARRRTSLGVGGQPPAQATALALVGTFRLLAYGIGAEEDGLAGVVGLEARDGRESLVPVSSSRPSLPQSLPLLSSVHRTHADLLRVFAHIPPSWLLLDGQDGASSAGTRRGIPALPPDPARIDASSGSGRSGADAVVGTQTSLDTLRRALQVETLLQLQRHALALDSADFRDLADRFLWLLGMLADRG
jgi:hypothetical protein